MTLPVSKDPTLIAITDKEILIYLIWAKIACASKFRENERKTVFMYERCKVTDALRKWQSGEPIPVADIREVFTALRGFQSAVHDDV